MTTELRKSERDAAAEVWAQGILAEVEKGWAATLGDVGPALEAAALSGVAAGNLQIELGASIAAVNQTARAWAKQRAAELIGMQYNEAGELVENENAAWVIAETTREKIKQIVSDAFAGDKPLAEVAAEIQDALAAEAEAGGIFSDARAEMIAATEVQRAQIFGNVEAWKQSGLVKKVKWLVSNLTPCDECAALADQEFDLDTIEPPPLHPNCRCVLQVSEIATESE